MSGEAMTGRAKPASGFTTHATGTWKHCPWRVYNGVQGTEADSSTGISGP